jgi:hypothetical protein
MNHSKLSFARPEDIDIQRSFIDEIKSICLQDEEDRPYIIGEDAQVGHHFEVKVAIGKRMECLSGVVTD